MWFLWFVVLSLSLKLNNFSCSYYYSRRSGILKTHIQDECIKKSGWTGDNCWETERAVFDSFISFQCQWLLSATMYIYPRFAYATATLLALHVHRGFLSKTLRGVPQKVVITFGPLYPKFCIGSFCSNSSRWSDFEKKCKIIILSTRTSHKKWLGRGKVTKQWWWSYKSNDTYLNHCLITFVYLIRDIFVNQKKAYSSRRKYQSGKKKFCWIRGENIRTIRVSQA